MNKVEWYKYPEHIPPVDEDFYAFTYSKPVLVYNGKEIDFGYLQIWEGDEYEPQWRQNNRDGWDIKNVTHWAYLPEPPK